jgi:hypothetical protein
MLLAKIRRIPHVEDMAGVPIVLAGILWISYDGSLYGALKLKLQQGMTPLAMIGAKALVLGPAGFWPGSRVSRHYHNR